MKVLTEGESTLSSLSGSSLKYCWESPETIRMWTWNCDSNFPDRNLPFVSDMVSAVPLCRKSISGYKFIHVKWMVTIMDSYNTGVFNVWAFISVKIFPLAPWWVEFSLLLPVRKMDSQQGRAKQNLFWNKCNFFSFHRPASPVLPWYCYSAAWGQKLFSLVFYFCLPHFIAFACLCIYTA